MLKSDVKAYCVLAVTVAFASVPFFVPFNGFDPGAYPNPQDDPAAQPAGYAFSIWGPIYLYLLASAVFGVVRRRRDEDWGAARGPLIASIAIGAAWLPIAERSPIAATVLIWAMLATALMALVRTPLADRWLLRAPVALYTGWLAAASSVSIALTGAGYGILFSETVWAVIAIGLATLITLTVLVTVERVPELAIAAIWALLAITLKNSQTTPSVAIIAGLACMTVALAVIGVSTSAPRVGEDDAQS